MTAEELAASRRYVGPVVRLAIACRIPPVAMARISVGFAVIAAIWLSVGSSRADVVALVAAVAVFVAVYVGQVLGAQSPASAVDWGLTACGLLGELCIYAGIAAGVSLKTVSAAARGHRGHRGRPGSDGRHLPARPVGCGAAAEDLRSVR
jgi:hypothetical protein